VTTSHFRWLYIESLESYIIKFKENSSKEKHHTSRNMT
jgi:hypothetical protein